MDDFQKTESDFAEASPTPKNQSQRKKLLVLDLDQTLIYSSNSLRRLRGGTIITYTIEGKIEQSVVFLRPGVVNLIKEMNQIYTLAIYTSSIREYAVQVKKLVDPLNLIKIMLCREDCVTRKQKKMKDLRKLNFDLRDVIIIDV